MLKRVGFFSILFVSLIFMSWQFPAPVPQEASNTRFVKLDHDGHTLPPWAGPWSCVLDNKTGLIWENKTDDETIHDGYWSYSWYDGKIGVPNLGDCYFKKDRCDVLDLIERVNQTSLCSKSKWRLPTANELSTLLDFSLPISSAKINEDVFPNTKRGDYWISEHEQVLEGIFKHLGKGANSINFGIGSTRILPYRNAAFVRLVTEDSKIIHSSLLESTYDR